MDFLCAALQSARSIPLSTYAGVIGTITVGTIAWEHYGRKKNWQKRPSVGLQNAATASKNFYDAVGRKAAWLSSYLTQIDLKDLGVTLADIGKPTWNLITSPVYAIIGYVAQARTYLNKEWMVYVGTTFMALMFAFGWYYLSNMYPRLNFWTKAYNYYLTYNGRQ